MTRDDRRIQGPSRFAPTQVSLLFHLHVQFETLDEALWFLELVVLGLFFWGWVLFFVRVFASRPQFQSFPFWNDDLCTPHTWRPTCAKKRQLSDCSAGRVLLVDHPK